MKIYFLQYLTDFKYQIKFYPHEYLFIKSIELSLKLKALYL